MAIGSFGNQGTKDIFEGTDSKAARKTCPKGIWSIARCKLDAINYAAALSDLAKPGNNLEKLKGELKGLYSVRINDQFRVIFRWNACVATDVAIVDYH